MTKGTKRICISLFSMLTLGCSTDASSDLNEESETLTETENTAPESFSLQSVPNDSKNASLTPTFFWEKAIDNEGDSVTYTVFLDTLENPEKIVARDITISVFELQENLKRNQDYYWKVVAKDKEGAETVSAENFHFTTRSFLLPERVSQTSRITARSGHTSLYFENKFWIFAGYNTPEPLDDAWSAENIEEWAEMNIPSNSSFRKKTNHTSLVYKNRMWVLGGSYSETAVLSSTDGVNWEQESSNISGRFPYRSYHSAVVFKDKMWIVAGEGSSGGILFHMNDVWNSEDGKNWVQVTENGGFPKRSEASLVTFNNKLYLMGGYSGRSDNLVYYNDVWMSEDGIQWTLVQENADFAPRYGHESVVFDDKIWVVGGDGEDDNNRLGGFSDAWYSEDGVSWTKAYDESKIGMFGRIRHSLTVANDKLYIIGGYYGGPSRRHLSDIWVIE